MTDEEARGVHSLAMMTIIGFAFFSAIFHFLVWQWRPWFGKPLPYSAMLDTITDTATRFLS